MPLTVDLDVVGVHRQRVEGDRAAEDLHRDLLERRLQLDLVLRVVELVGARTRHLPPATATSLSFSYELVLSGLPSCDRCPTPRS
jgi:hypothetical protein